MIADCGFWIFAGYRLLNGRKEALANKRAFARTADASDDDESAERKMDGKVFEIVRVCVVESQMSY